MKPRKIALFGGTFDPVHRAHLAIAEQAVRRCDLNRVLFIPCPQSPHKQAEPGADPEERIAMLRLATADLAWAEVTPWEIERESETPAYSWITATHFSEEFPGAELFWILGSDQWNKIQSWSRPELLAELLTFIVFPRGEEPHVQEDFRSVRIDFSIPGSSTEARASLRKGDLPRGLVPEPVLEYIREHHLYGLRPD